MLKRSVVEAASKKRRQQQGAYISSILKAFNKAEVEEIRRLWVDTDVTRKGLARTYNVSQVTIGNVLNGTGAYTYDEDALRCPHGSKLA